MHVAVRTNCYTALVARRIEELQARNERKAEMAAMTRDELVQILTDIIKAAAPAYQRLGRLTALKPLRCSPRCAVGTSRSESMCRAWK
jgi:hypothetical protein